MESKRKLLNIGEYVLFLVVLAFAIATTTLYLQSLLSDEPQNVEQTWAYPTERVNIETARSPGEPMCEPAGSPACSSNEYIATHQAVEEASSATAIHKTEIAPATNTAAAATRQVVRATENLVVQARVLATRTAQAASATVTSSPSPTGTPTQPPSTTNTPELNPEATGTLTPTQIITVSSTPTPLASTTATPTVSATPTDPGTPMASETPTRTSAPTATITNTPTVTSTVANTPEPAIEPSETLLPTPTPAPEVMPTKQIVPYIPGQGFFVVMGGFGENCEELAGQIVQVNPDPYIAGRRDVEVKGSDCTFPMDFPPLPSDKRHTKQI